MIGARRLAERTFAAAGLLMFTGALVPLLRQDPGSPIDDVGGETGDPVKQVIWWIFYLGALLLLATRWRRTLATIARHPLLWSVCAIALASTSWSVAPDVTLRRAFALLMSTAFAVYLASAYTVREQLAVAAWALAGAAVMSAAFALALPAYGVMSGLHEGAWRGIYVHKNGLGHAMSLAVLVLAVSAAASRTRTGRALAVAGAVLALGVLIRSRSLTSILTLVVVTAAWQLSKIARWPFTLAVPAFILTLLGGTAAGAWLAAHAAAVLALFGKDPSLTGRMELWTYVVTAIRQRPWLGYGYGAFWGDWNDASVQIWLSAGWDAPHAHNGLLQLWLDLGIAGMVSCSLLVARAVRDAVRFLRTVQTPVRAWPIACLAYTATYTLTESALVQHNSVQWILLVTAALAATSPAGAAADASGARAVARGPGAPAGRRSDARIGVARV